MNLQETHSFGKSPQARSAMGLRFNSGLAIAGLTCFVETFVPGSTFVLRMNFSAKNPRHRKAAKTLCDIPKPPIVPKEKFRKFTEWNIGKR